jgi:hypothetical protein
MRLVYPPLAERGLLHRQDHVEGIVCEVEAFARGSKKCGASHHHPGCAAMWSSTTIPVATDTFIG